MTSRPVGGRKLSAAVVATKLAARGGGLTAAGFRVVLREVLFDGEGVPDWHEQAACRGADPAPFYPPTGHESGELTGRAKELCAQCPVVTRCLVDALRWERAETRYGVAGGLSAKERAQLVRSQQRAVKREVA